MQSVGLKMRKEEKVQKKKECHLEQKEKFYKTNQVWNMIYGTKFWALNKWNINQVKIQK